MEDIEGINSLEPLVRNNEIKAVFVGGKGGVGKTTCSASIALQFAEKHPNKKILLISTDPAHNVSDAFVQQFSGEPIKVNGCENLFACEVDPAAAMEKELAYFDNGDSTNTDESVFGDMKSFVTNLPGIDEAMALSSVLNFIDDDEDSVEKDNFDIIVFDTAPTGHTLRLLQLPTILKLGLEKLTSWKTRFASMFSTMTSLLYKDESKDNQQERLKKLEERMNIWLKAVTKLTTMFKDIKSTQFVCVCNASFLSVYETKRLMNELKIAQIHSKYVIVNMLMPRSLAELKIEGMAENISTILKSHEIDNSVVTAVKDAVILCSGVSKMQKHYLNILEKDNDTNKTILLPLLSGEIRGVKNLKSFSERLLKLDNKLNINEQDKQQINSFSKINLEINTNNTYKVKTKATLMKKTMFIEKEIEILYEIGMKIKVKGLESKPELNGKEGKIVNVESLKENGRVGVKVDGNSILLKTTNLEVIKEEENSTENEGIKMDNVTPEMMSLVQSMIMKPGGIQEMLNHDLVKQLKTSNDEEMKTFFTDIETNGLFAGLKYLSNKYVMAKLAEIAKQLQP